MAKPEARSVHARPGRIDAFTLVELLIVVVLVAIAATLTIPWLADTDATRVQAAARLLAADLDFAKIESITHPDDTCLVSFDQANNTYTVAKSSAPSTPMTDPSTNQPYVTQFGTGRAAESAGVTIQAYSLDGDNELAFGMYGQTDQTTQATITLQAGAYTVTVQVDPASGETSLQAVSP
ncbi:MAG: prepilin-type N-terminal cleavage/methylation domain-containing protein [Phycisphaerae bacterium]